MKLMPSGASLLSLQQACSLCYLSLACNGLQSKPQLQCGQSFRAVDGLQLPPLCPYESGSAPGLRSVLGTLRHRTCFKHRNDIDVRDRERKWSWSYSRYSPDISLEKQKKFTRILVRIAEVKAEIRTRDLYNMNREYCAFSYNLRSPY
jgi:hypothetical protein